MKHKVALAILIGFGITFACTPYPKTVDTNPAVKAQRFPSESFDSVIEDYVDRMMKTGRQVFRYDTFGSEAFWGDKLKLHEAIASEKEGGIGAGLTPKRALEKGAQSRSRVCSRSLLEVIKGGAVSLENPKTTVELLRANGIKGGFYHDGRFATLRDVVQHYDAVFHLKLTEREKADLVEYLKSL